MDHSGLITLLPTIIVLAAAIITHRPVASLILGVLVGITLTSPKNILGTFSEISLEVMQDPQVHEIHRKMKNGCPKFVSEVIWEGKALIYKHCWSKDRDNFWIQIVSVVI